MNLMVSVGPIVALIAGVLILVMPRLLNYIVAIYLIIVGLLGLFGPGISVGLDPARGGWRAFVACSNEYASRISVFSLHAGPMKEIPTGRPCRSRQAP